MSHPEVDLLTSTQVATMFGVTRKTVGLWARSGALRPSWKSPGPVGAYLFDRATVERVLAHRLAYEAEYGPIPDDMGIDHRCRVRNCVTPEHLEPVSAAENARRGRRASSLAVGDTCANGHLIEAGGLYERPSGKTECRLCRQSESSRKGIQRPTTQRRVADTRAAHARAS